MKLSKTQLSKMVQLGEFIETEFIYDLLYNPFKINESADGIMKPFKEEFNKNKALVKSKEDAQ